MGVSAEGMRVEALISRSDCKDVVWITGEDELAWIARQFIQKYDKHPASQIVEKSDGRNADRLDRGRGSDVVSSSPGDTSIENAAWGIS